ncbi:MAG: polymerase, sigma-24 subunit, subfamily [Marmoricola sp.]|nr:polymerase, sigma-24 subunit, subfamily [Marmoricola sp.]
MRDLVDFQEFAVARTTPLFRTAWLMCGDAHTAEDLVQETLAKVYLAWGSRRIDNPAGYAHVTLMRTFVSLRRRRMTSERPIAVIPETSVETRSHSGDVELRIDLMAALDKLSAPDRAVLVARYFDDCTIDVIAAALGKTSAATRRQASRALERLRLVLGPDFALEGELR